MTKASISRIEAGAALLVTLAMPIAAAAQDGATLFKQRCGACHTVEAGKNRVGPSLAGVVGRTAGRVDGARYSDAMRKSGIVWDRKSLDGFLAAPRHRVPGTTMPIGVPNPAQRQAIVDYLAGAK